MSDKPKHTDVSLNVKELCAALSDKMTNPFNHADMNQRNIDWQGAYNAMREEINQGDYPMAIIAFLDAVAANDPETRA